MPVYTPQEQKAILTGMKAGTRVLCMKAVFAGTFDPPTAGHLDIIKRASGLFDELHVVVGHNLGKSPFLDIDVRIALLGGLAGEEGLGNVVIARWDGLTAEYARSRDCRVLVRSVRDEADLGYERTMALMSARLFPGVETLFMFARPDLVDVSSSAVRELVRWGRVPAGIVPDLVRNELEKRFGPLQ